MIAYNTGWLSKLIVQRQIEAARCQNSITSEEYLNAIKLYPVGFYTPNIFIRMGLFILTIIGTLSFGLFFLFVIEGYDDGLLSALLVLFSVICYLALEIIVNKKKQYKAGVDDAFLWASAGFLFAAAMIYSGSWLTTEVAIILIISLFYTLRFLNILMAGIAVLALLTLVYLFYIDIFSGYTGGLSILLSLLSATIYYFSRSLANKSNFKHYASALKVVQITALLCVYATINTFVAMSQNITKFALPVALPIYFRWLFWLLTTVLPFVYIYYGIKKKDLILGRVGLILIIPTAFIIRIYYSILPIEIAMVTSGICLIVLSYYCIKYLQPSKNGFTSLASSDVNNLSKFNLEALVIAETLSAPATPSQPDINYNGGNFGGGGASGEF